MAIRVSELGNEAGTYQALDDRGLVLDFQAGEVDAYHEIFRRYRALAWSIAYRLLGSVDDAEEATQETMLRVLQGLPRFNGRYQLQAWVARIATNVSLDRLRARARRPHEAVTGPDAIEDLHADPQQDPFELVERVLEREKVLAVLDELPEHHRRALVLRELEGRSHQEIGEALDITPAQAKALIHRAKVSFRRAWSDGNGHGRLAALIPWGLFPLRIPNLLKRLFGSITETAGGQVAQQAATQAAAATTASPAVAATVTSSAERITAAAMAVLVAGSVTAGVVAVNKAKPEPPKSHPSPAAVRVVVPVVAPTVPRGTIVERDPRPAGKHPAKKHHQHRKGADAPADASQVPAGGSPDAPPSDPSDPPTGPTTAPIPPAPAWGFSFEVDGLSVESCGCDPTPQIMSSTVSGEPSGTVTFSQTIKGAAYDAQGDATWPFYLDWSGTAGSDQGRLGFRFLLSSGAGLYWYSGSAAQQSRVVGDDGAVTYTYAGAYALEDGKDPVAGIPVQGAFTATVGVWPDGTIVLGSVDLA